VDATSPFQGSLSISSSSDNNRCYQVVVSAANGSGTSATNATSATVLVTQNISSVSTSHTPTTSQVDGVQLTGTVDTGNDLATTFNFQWRRSTTLNESTNSCTGAANIVWLIANAANFGSVVTVNDPQGATSKTNMTTTTSGTTQDYCYWLDGSADNLATSGTPSQNDFLTQGGTFVEGNG
jgi:hypothetical protein